MVSSHNSILLFRDFLCSISFISLFILFIELIQMISDILYYTDNDELVAICYY